MEPGGRLAKILEGQALLLFEIPDYHCEVDSLGDIGQGHKLLGFLVGVEVDSSEFGGGILCRAQNFLFFNDPVVDAVKFLGLHFFLDQL